MDTQKAYDDFYQLLQNGDEMPINLRLYDILENYAKARLYDLVGIDVPMHVYFQEEYHKKTDTSESWCPIRINPYTGEICREKWDYGTRAFYNERGVFVDFSVVDNQHKKQLKGYTKIDHLIDFAFTLEHELQHVLQFYNINTRVITYDNYKVIKNVIALAHIQNQDDDYSKYFYINAHNDLFLELDANNQAESFVGSQIRLRGLSQIIVDSFGEKKYDINSILKKRIDEAHISRGDVDYVIEMLFGFNDSKKHIKLTDNPEKIIDLLVDGLVRQNPSGYLKKYPLLNDIYNPDGTRKSYYEMTEASKQNPQLEPFYRDVVSNSPLLRIQKLEQEMVNSYCNELDDNKKTQILDNGLAEISSIIENENVDIDNILIYLDRRIREIEKTQISNQSISILVFILTKQVLLHRSMIKSAYLKTTEYKEDLLECREILKNCDIDLDAMDVKEKLDNLITVLKYDHINKIYSSKGYSKEEIGKFIAAAERYQQLINRVGYIFNDDVTLASKKSPSVLTGYDNLYQTNYYKNIIAKNTNPEERARLKDEFELINQVYIELQRNIRRIGAKGNESAIFFEKKSPIIIKILDGNPNIVETLYKIREMEENTSYLTRLDAAIIQCESYMSDNNKRMAS